MKKSIFDLTYDEGRKLQKEFNKTSYYKQYSAGALGTLIIFGILSIIYCLPIIFEEPSDNSYITPLIIVAGFICLFYIIFFFKTFDLMKLYYDEKKKEKKRSNL